MESRVFFIIRAVDAFAKKFRLKNDTIITSRCDVVISIAKQGFDTGPSKETNQFFRRIAIFKNLIINCRESVLGKFLIGIKENHEN